jgi:hypothetical protein
VLRRSKIVLLRLEVLGKGKPVNEKLTFQRSALPAHQEEIINPSSTKEEKSAEILKYDQASRVLGVVLPI